MATRGLWAVGFLCQTIHPYRCAQAVCTRHCCTPSIWLELLMLLLPISWLVPSTRQLPHMRRRTHRRSVQVANMCTHGQHVCSPHRPHRLFQTSPSTLYLHNFVSHLAVLLSRLPRCTPRATAEMAASAADRPRAIVLADLDGTPPVGCPHCVSFAGRGLGTWRHRQDMISASPGARCKACSSSDPSTPGAVTKVSMPSRAAASDVTWRLATGCLLCHNYNLGADCVA